LRRIVVRGIAVEESVGDDLVDDLLLEILRVSHADEHKKRCYKHCCKSEFGRRHGTPLGQIGLRLVAGNGVELLLPYFTLAPNNNWNPFHFRKGAPEIAVAVTARELLD
jgi:hypothetical protein